MTHEEKRSAPWAFLAGAVVVLLLLGGFYLLTRYTQRSGPTGRERLPMTAAERAYSDRIHFHDLQMKRVANFLGQEVTFLFGSVANDGTTTVREIEVTIEFRDVFNQVVLRDTRRMLGSRAAPLAAGQRREFQIGFEHVPGEWNQQFPTMRVTGLLLE